MDTHRLRIAGVCPCSTSSTTVRGTGRKAATLRPVPCAAPCLLASSALLTWPGPCRRPYPACLLAPCPCLAPPPPCSVQHEERQHAGEPGPHPYLGTGESVHHAARALRPDGARAAQGRAGERGPGCRRAGRAGPGVRLGQGPAGAIEELGKGGAKGGPAPVACPTLRSSPACSPPTSRRRLCSLSTLIAGPPASTAGGGARGGDGGAGRRRRLRRPPRGSRRRCERPPPPACALAGRLPSACPPACPLSAAWQPARMRQLLLLQAATCRLFNQTGASTACALGCLALRPRRCRALQVGDDEKDDVKAARDEQSHGSEPAMPVKPHCGRLPQRRASAACCPAPACVVCWRAV